MRAKEGKALIGQRGETAVCELLLSKGHRILERNWRCGHLEVDIISLSDDGLHFVEVKSRVAPTSAQPEDNISFRKQINLSKAALRYVRHHSEFSDETEIWLDVAAVIFDGHIVTIRYSPGAIIPLHA